MPTKCVFCGHKELHPAQTQYIYRNDNKFLIVNDVPCLQCTYCGEQYFEGPMLKNIEKKFDEIHVQGHKASQEIHIPVEPFMALQKRTTGSTRSGASYRRRRSHCGPVPLGPS